MTRQKVSGKRAMIAQMQPVLDAQRYCYVEITPSIAPRALQAAFATFREDEGVSAIVPEPLARALGHQGPTFARIILGVFSDLEGVGLTAAASGALDRAGIACNMVAALNHDHVFVPAERGQEALETLKRLSEDY